MGSTVGVLYGTASSTRFDLAVTDAGLRRLDYVTVHHEGRQVLCQIDDVVRKSGLRFEEALEASPDTDDRLAAQAQVVGYLEGGRVETPRTPFAAGQEAHWADESLVTSVLGLEPDDGAYLGRIKGSSTPVRLSMNMLAQKHVSVLAKTGAGKSYTVGVLLEEFLAAGVPLVILDPHGEYGSLRHANIDPGDVGLMAAHGIKPRSFDKQVHEYALDTNLNPDSQPLRLEGINLEGREIVDLLGGKLSGGQVGLLYQAVKEVKEHLPGYTIQDIMDAVQRNKSSAKWNVINALEALEGTGVFHIRGTAVADLVKPKACTIINLKGVAPDVQEVAVARLVGLLWEARKRNDVPPFILVCEEAHNFCPERGVGTAVSGPVVRTVASEGRKFGMGLVIVSQRPAKIDKNVLSQCNTQFVLKVTNPNDLKAIVSSVEGITAKASDEVQRLAIGTALVAGGGLTQPVFVDVRPRLTRHGGQSVVVVGEGRRGTTPKVRAEAKTPLVQQSKDPAPVPTVLDLPPAFRPASASELQSNASDRTDAQQRDISRILASVANQAPESGTIRHAQPPKSVKEPVGQHAPSGRSAAANPPGPAKGAQQPADAMQHLQSPAATPSEPLATAPTWSAHVDGPAIQRVAARVGIVGSGRNDLETIEFVRHLALQNGRNPDMRLGLYAEIGRKVCHAEEPVCIRCPLADSCQHHQQLRTERKKSRVAIRRLWNR